MHLKLLRKELMENSDYDIPSDNDWEDRGELAWNEFDWERYLKEQEAAIKRYVELYEKNIARVDRIDYVAEKMGWESADSLDEETAEDEALALFEESVDFVDEDDVYTLHKNPVYISTRGLYAGLRKPWEILSIDPTKIPTPLAINFASILHVGEEQAIQGIHALDFGDYAMAISLFKRALSLVNNTMGLISAEKIETYPDIQPYAQIALPRLFDLREIWLRVINECRRELKRPIDEEN